jgi:hypothetical protein
MAFVVAGASEWYVPFKGGTLVPAPDAILGPWPTDSVGNLTLASPWPDSVPSGAETTLQVWIAGAFIPPTFSATSAVRITAP